MEIKVDNFNRPIEKYVIPQETIECNLKNDYIVFLDGSAAGLEEGKNVNVGRLTIEDCYIETADFVNMKAEEIRIKNSYIGTIRGTGMNAKVFDVSDLYTERSWLLKNNIELLYPPLYCAEAFDLSLSKIKSVLLPKDRNICTMHLDGVEIEHVDGNGYLINTRSYNPDSKTKMPDELYTILGLGKYKFKYSGKPRMIA